MIGVPNLSPGFSAADQGSKVSIVLLSGRGMYVLPGTWPTSAGWCTRILITHACVAFSCRLVDEFLKRRYPNASSSSIPDIPQITAPSRIGRDSAYTSILAPIPCKSLYCRAMKGPQNTIALDPEHQATPRGAQPINDPSEVPVSLYKTQVGSLL